MEISLDASGNEFIRRQQRSQDYLQLLEEHLDTEVTRPQDSYLGEVLQRSKILSALVQALQGAPHKVTAKRIRFSLTYHKVTASDQPEQLSDEQIGELLGQLQQYTTVSCPENVSDEAYPAFVDFFFDFLQELAQFYNFPQFDFNSPSSSHNDMESKCAINHIPGCIQIKDVNLVHAKNGNFFGNTLWAVYIAIFFGGLGFTFMTLNMPLYVIQGLGGNALDSTLLQTCFSLGQLVGSPLLHMLSEHIGRKTIYFIAYFVYILTTIALAYSSEEIFGSFALPWIYIIRVVQGLFGIIQPMAFTIITDLVPPENRAIAISTNNMMFMIAALVVTVLNAFVLPYIPGAYPENNNFTIFRSSLWASLVFFALGLIFIALYKESCPAVLLKRECKRLGTKYIPQKKNEVSWRSALKTVFGSWNMIFLFTSYVLGFGTSVLNQNVASILLSRFMILRSALESYVKMSYMVLVGIGLMLVFTALFYKPLLKKFGDLNVLIVVLLLSIITTALRRTGAPLSFAQLFISVIFNQFANGLTDAPFLLFASLNTTPQSRGKVMGIFMTGNSIARAMLSAVGGALVDWHWRNGQMFFMYFSLASIIFLCFFKAPKARFNQAK